MNRPPRSVPSLLTQGFPPRRWPEKDGTRALSQRLSLSGCFIDPRVQKTNDSFSDRPLAGIRSHGQRGRGAGASGPTLRMQLAGCQPVNASPTSGDRRDPPAGQLVWYAALVSGRTHLEQVNGLALLIEASVRRRGATVQTSTRVARQHRGSTVLRGLLGPSGGKASSTRRARRYRVEPVSSQPSP